MIDRIEGKLDVKSRPAAGRAGVVRHTPLTSLSRLSSIRCP